PEREREDAGGGEEAARRLPEREGLGRRRPPSSKGGAPPRRVERGDDGLEEVGRSLDARERPHAPRHVVERDERLAARPAGAEVIARLLTFVGGERIIEEGREGLLRAGRGGHEASDDPGEELLGRAHSRQGGDAL